MFNRYLKILTYHKMTWIEETEMDIFTAIVYLDHDKLLDFHSSPGNGLPLGVVFFALVVKNIDMIEMIEFLLVDLKYEWYNYYADYLKNYTEERMKIRDILWVVRDDQWLNAYRLAISTDNINELEYLCMFNYNLTDDGHMLEYAISSGHSNATQVLRRFMGTNREIINTIIGFLQEI